MKNRFRLLILLVVLLLVPLTASAAPNGAGGAGPVTMQAEAGFDGKAKMGAWVPVTVTVKNDGAEFEGALGFEVRSNLGPGAHTGIYRYPLVVPAGAAKRVELLVPYDMSTRQIEIELWKGEERLAAAAPALEISRDILVGVLGAEPADLPFLAGRQAGDRAVRLIRLDPATMPTEMRVLENLDAVLLDRFTYSELPEPQRKSLEAWVEHGGTLLLSAGPEAKRLEGVAPWAPLSLKSVDSVALTGVGQATLARFDLAGNAGWRVTQRIGTEPVAAAYKKGMGSIHLLMFDPALEPFAGWQGTPDLLMTMLPTMRDPSNGGMGGMGGGPNGKAAMVMVDALNQFPLRDVPSARGLVWLLAGYAVLIGPVHFLLLRGFKKVGWALLTLPILAMAGGAGAWAYTRQAHGVDSLANSISVIEAQPGSSTLKVQSLVGFFMPPASSHKVTMGNAVLSPVAVPFMFFQQTPGSTTTEVRTTFENVHTAALGPRDDWAMYALSAEGTAPVSGTVEGTLKVDSDHMAGTLTSKLPFKLTGAVVASGSSFQRLGDLNPGDTAEVSLMQSAFNVQYGGDNPLAEVLARANEFRGFTGPTPTAEEYAQMRRSQMAWVTSNAISWIRSPDKPPVVLVGWAEYQALPITVDGRKADTTAIALYVQPLTSTVSHGDFTLPASWTQPRSAAYNGQVGVINMTMGWNLAKGDNVVLEFGIDESLKDRVTDIELRMPALARGQNGAYPVAFAFYRWADGAWVDVPEELEGASPADDAAFVGPGGAVRVKVTQMIEERVPLAVPGLMVRGRGVSR